MKNKIKWIWIAGWSEVIMALEFFGMSISGDTYTVTTPIWTTTNAIEISRCSDWCMLIRYVEKGVTGEFHAFGVPVAIETNTVKIGQFANHIPPPPPKSLVNPKENLWEIESGSNPTNPTYTMTVYGWKYTNLHYLGPYVQPILSGPTNNFTIPLPTTEWMNDAVWYTTNTMANDVERNRADPQTNGWYVKTVITTNGVQPVYFMAGDKTIELGARDDGVVVWRNKK